jgi:hypothetical protein
MARRPALSQNQTRTQKRVNPEQTHSPRAAYGPTHHHGVPHSLRTDAREQTPHHFVIPTKTLPNATDSRAEKPKEINNDREKEGGKRLIIHYTKQIHSTHTTTTYPHRKMHRKSSTGGGSGKKPKPLISKTQPEKSYSPYMPQSSQYYSTDIKHADNLTSIEKFNSRMLKNDYMITESDKTLGKWKIEHADQFSTKADTTQNIAALKEDYVNEVIFFHIDDLDVKHLVLLHNLLKNIESSLKKMTQTWDYEPVIDDGYAALHKAVKIWLDFPMQRQSLPPILYPAVKALAYLPLTDEEVKTNTQIIPPEGLYFPQTDMGGVAGPDVPYANLYLQAGTTLNQYSTQRSKRNLPVLQILPLHRFTNHHLEITFYVEEDFADEHFKEYKEVVKNKRQANFEIKDGTKAAKEKAQKKTSVYSSYLASLANVRYDHTTEPPFPIPTVEPKKETMTAGTPTLYATINTFPGLPTTAPRPNSLTGPKSAGDGKVILCRTYQSGGAATDPPQPQHMKYYVDKKGGIQTAFRRLEGAYPSGIPTKDFTEEMRANAAYQTYLRYALIPTNDGETSTPLESYIQTSMDTCAECGGRVAHATPIHLLDGIEYGVVDETK